MSEQHCSQCYEALRSQLAQAQQERDEAIEQHGKESGFWGRAAAREVAKRKQADQQVTALREALEGVLPWVTSTFLTNKARALLSAQEDHNAKCS